MSVYIFHHFIGLQMQQPYRRLLFPSRTNQPCNSLFLPPKHQKPFISSRHLASHSGGRYQVNGWGRWCWDKAQQVWITERSENITRDSQVYTLIFSIEFYHFSIKVYLTKDKVKMGMNYCLNKAHLNRDTDGTRFKQILSKILIYSNINCVPVYVKCCTKHRGYNCE